jgi:glycosyltransferase involved in cell wall biosynthesis
VKFALVTPRYGAEITHGAEHACRLIAEQLAERHAVDVVTTCARDPQTWKNEYSEGADRIRGVLVRRFAAAAGRDPQAFDAFSRRLFTSAHSRSDELEWIRRSGTSSAGLLDFLRRQQRTYDALVFFTYAAGTTVEGMSVAPERSVLFPGASVDPALRLLVAQDTLASASAIGYSSTAERRVVRAYARHRPKVEEIVGVGVGTVHESSYPRLIEPPPEPDEAAEDGSAEARDVHAAPSHLAGRGVLFRRRHRLHGRFVLYAGPIDSSNGTEELLEYFASYAPHDTETPLVLLGVKMMKLPAEPWVRSAGVLAERDRIAALESAEVAVSPDPDDLLGEHTLEAMAAGTPVLATARNAAAVEHVRKANAGLYYANRDEFVEAMRRLMSSARLREALGRNGRRYVQQHYRWDAVIGRFERLVSRVAGRGRP